MPELPGRPEHLLCPGLESIFPDRNPRRSVSIDDEIGTRFLFDKESGQPVFFAPQVVQGEIYTHLWNLVSKCYEMPGISQSIMTKSKGCCAASAGRPIYTR